MNPTGHYRGAGMPLRAASVPADVVFFGRLAAFASALSIPDGVIDPAQQQKAEDAIWDFILAGHDPVSLLSDTNTPPILIRVVLLDLIQAESERRAEYGRVWGGAVFTQHDTETDDDQDDYEF